MSLLRALFVGSIRTGVVMLATFACASSAFAGGGSPVGSGFSYQGVLQSAGAPFSGTADLRFTLYDDASGGGVVGAPVTVIGQSIVDGQFTTTLDFGLLAFNGEERWMEIEVCAPSTGGSGPYTPLTPRQRLAPVPYALRALNASISGAQPNAVQLTNTSNQYAGSSMNIDSGTFQVDPVLDAVGIGIVPDSGYRLRVAAVGNDYGLSATANGDGAAVGGLNLNPAGHAAYFEGRTALMGNVGINEDNPQFPLQIRGNGGVYVAQGLGYSFYHASTDDSEYYGALGANPTDDSFVISNLAAGPLSFRTGTAPFFVTERMRIASDGNVGIGTSAPTAKLHVGGTAGVDGIRYPDGSFATKAPTGGFTAAGAPDPSATTTFLSPIVTITVTSSSQQFLVQANRAFGSSSPGGASNLNLYIGYQLTGGGGITTYGGGVLGLTAAQGQRHLYGLSAVVTGLAPGTYFVGLAGYSGSPNWNSNEWGYTTAVSLN